MPEPAKTRQPRQRTKPAAAGAGSPKAATEDSVAAPEPIVAEEAVETEAIGDAVADVAEPEESDADDVDTDETGAGEDADAEDTEAEDTEAEDTEAEEPEDLDEVEEPVKPAAKPAPKPAPTPSKRQVERNLATTEKRRIAAEKERRKAEFNAARIRQQEADRVQLWADRRQAEADKARAKAKKAAAKADAVRKTAGENPTGFAAQRVATAERWELYTRENLDRTQSDADTLRKRARKSGVHSTRAAGKVANPGSRQWVPPTFIAVGLLGVIWLVVYYITASTSIYVPVMSDLGGWNVVIGMGLMASSFGIATLWK